MADSGLLQLLANPRMADIPGNYAKGLERGHALAELLRTDEARKLQGEALSQGHQFRGPLAELLFPDQSPAMDRLYQVDPQRGMETRKFINADKLARLDDFTSSISAATTPEAYAQTVSRWKSRGVEFGPGEDLFENRQKVLDQMNAVRQRFSGGNPTDDMREYELARTQGFKGDFVDYQMSLKQAGADRNVNINNAGAHGETEYQKTLGKQLAERWGKLAEDGDAAQEELAIVGQLRNVLPRGGTMTGVAGLLAEWGIGGEGMSDIQATQALVDRLTPKQRAPGSGATSDFDAKMFRNSLPSLWRTPEGNAVILDTMEALSLYRQARGKIAYGIMDGSLTREQAVEEFKKLPDPFATFKAYRKRAAAGQDRGSIVMQPQNGGKGKGDRALTLDEINQELQRRGVK